MVEQLQFCVDSCSSADGKYTTLDEAERRYVKKKKGTAGPLAIVVNVVWFRSMILASSQLRKLLA